MTMYSQLMLQPLTRSEAAFSRDSSSYELPDFDQSFRFCYEGLNRIAYIMWKTKNLTLDLQLDFQLDFQLEFQ